MQQPRQHGILISMVIVVGLLLQGQGASPTVTSADAQQPGDSGLVRELAERLLAQPYGGPPGSMTPPVQLLPGALPADLPLTVTIPPGGRILGSMLRPAAEPGRPTVGGPGDSTTIVVDAPGAPADIVAFYQQALEAQGWLRAPSSPSPQLGGFQTAATVSSNYFCQPRDAGWAMATVAPQRTGPNDVRLTLNAGPGPCSAPMLPPSSRPPGAELLPPLDPPPGVTLQSGGGTLMGPNRWTSEATALTDRSLADLEAFFAPQLQAAGWTRIAGRVDGPLAWSLWQVPAEGNWQGALLVQQGPGENRRLLTLRVDSDAPVAFGAGYVSPPPPPMPVAPPMPGSGGFAPAPPLRPPN